MLEELIEKLRHVKDRHNIKVQLIKYINKYSKKEVQEIVDEIRRK